MPIVQFHLVEGHYTDEQHERLLVEASRLFAAVLEAPVDRVRVFIHLYKPGLAAIGGVPASREAQRAPYFEFVVLEGRPLEHRQRLLAGFTDLCVDILGAPRNLVRGSATTVHPDDWAIAGTPASVLRAAEIAARAKEAAGDAESGS